MDDAQKRDVLSESMKILVVLLDGGDDPLMVLADDVFRTGNQHGGCEKHDSQRRRGSR